ncbi:MAG: 5'/3'-nucleotidase SurE [Rhodospirillaceae bacterium TMED140]|nr:5'/3'-nucleotidase SurE [Rhodospirillaceae bacterium]OUX71769.1 MAG: 5'/3'-nucleotidase SurE [Rhodospirillaceae bacterium TMED140]
MSMVGDRLNPAVAAQLKGKRVLVTNDDGIDADGLARLETLARRYCDDVWVIAPATHQSARSRGITLRTPLRVVELGEQRAAVTGTPLDTFMVGMQHFFDDRLPDLVLSGINHGGNTGADIGYSGTCGIVMEAAMHGIRGIAFSQHTVGGVMDWSVADAHLNRVFDQVMQVSVPETIPLSVNFPAAMATEPGADSLLVVPQGFREDKIGLTPDEDEEGPFYSFGHLRDNTPGSPVSDVAAVVGGRISVTPLRFKCDHTDFLESVGTQLDLIERMAEDEA